MNGSAHHHALIAQALADVRRLGWWLVVLAIAMNLLLIGLGTVLLMLWLSWGGQLPAGQP